MFLSLLSMLGGGVLRLLPELLSYLNRRQDNQHELNMLSHQVELEKLRQTGVAQMADIQQAIQLIQAHKEALSGQMQRTGFVVVDALNFLVRPIFAYWSLALYSVFKLSALSAQWPNIAAVYSADDFALLSGICSFYFVGRVFDKAALK